MNELANVKRVHVIGAGGIGLSAAAKLLKHDGREVTGSDVAASGVTGDLVRMGIPVTIGHAAANVPGGTDLVLYSGAVPATNPEREEAVRRGIRQLSYFDFIGLYSRGKRTVAVSGTNGKSTTTAMLGMILADAGLDPTVIVGSKVASFPDGNLRPGKSDMFVVEACEHEANMLKIAAETIVLTNIEADHLDFYRDLDHIRETFQRYVDALPEQGLLVLNNDDHVSAHDIVRPGHTLTYGFDAGADRTGGPISVTDGRQRFTVRDREGERCAITLSVPGRFNASNALAAATAAAALGVAWDDIAASLARYSGIWRRFERVGERGGALIVSDYGHHPTAVAATVAAAREFFPGRRIVLAFQPHQHNRTRNLFGDFVASFDGADVTLLVEVFDVAGREEAADAHIGSQDLVDAVLARDAQRGVAREVLYAKDIDAAEVRLRDIIREDDVVLVMGAGSVYRIAERLVKG